jgi:hypothetical protein
MGKTYSEIIRIYDAVPKIQRKLDAIKRLGVDEDEFSFPAGKCVVSIERTRIPVTGLSAELLFNHVDGDRTYKYGGINDGRFRLDKNGQMLMAHISSGEELLLVRLEKDKDGSLAIERPLYSRDFGKAFRGEYYGREMMDAINEAVLAESVLLAGKGGKLMAKKGYRYYGFEYKEAADGSFAIAQMSNNSFDAFGPSNYMSIDFQKSEKEFVARIIDAAVSGAQTWQEANPKKIKKAEADYSEKLHGILDSCDWH